jgi:hypothetical protein
MVPLFFHLQEIGDEEDGAIYLPKDALVVSSFLIPPHSTIDGLYYPVIVVLYKMP